MACSLRFRHRWQVCKWTYERKDDSTGFSVIKRDVLHENFGELYGFQFANMFLHSLLGCWVYEFEWERLLDGNTLILKDGCTREWIPRDYYVEELGVRGIRDLDFKMKANCEATRREVEHNFLKIPYNDGNGFFAYGIRYRRQVLTPDGRWI